MELKEMIRAVWSRAWLIAIVIVLSCAATGLATHYLIVPTYEASTKLVVNKTENSEFGLTWDDVTVNVQLVGTYKELLRTEAVMDAVSDRLPELGLTADELLGKISVTSPNATQVMTVVVTDVSYERAALIANTLSEAFKDLVKDVMKVDNVTVLSRASMDIAPPPVTPNLSMNMAISFALSLILGMGVVFMLHYLDETIKSEQDVRQYLEMPVLAVVKKIGKHDLIRTRASKANRQAEERVYVAAKS